MQIRVKMLADCGGERKIVSCIIETEQKTGNRILRLWRNGMDKWKVDDCVFLDKLFRQLSYLMKKRGEKPLTSFEDMYLERIQS